MENQSKIERSLDEVRRRIAESERMFDRSEGSVALTAASKTQPVASIEEALAAGHRQFGENRVQEAEQKWPLLKQKYPDTKLHLIGPLQTNKAASAVAIFDVIETIDRVKLAKAVARLRVEKKRDIACYVQVNTGQERQKAGVAPNGADELISICKMELNLPIIGLMCIPPANEEPALHFCLLKEIASRNGIQKLSMGMSTDFEVAIQFGSTAVRIGTSIFGKRSNSN